MGMKMKKYFMRKIKPLYIECKYNYFIVVLNIDYIINSTN